MEFQINTTGLGQKTGVFSIDETSIRFRDKQIRTAEVESIATSMGYQSSALARHLCVKLWIATESDMLSLSFTGTNAFFSKSVTIDSVARNFIALRKAIYDYAGPYVLQRLIESLTDRGEIKIGRFTLNSYGVTHKGSLKGEVRAEWSDGIELRQNTEPPVHKKVLDVLGMGNQMQYCDQWSIFFRNSMSGKVIRLGDFSFEDKNGYFLLFLIPQLMKVHQDLF